MLGPGFRQFIADKCGSSRPWNWLDAGSGTSSAPSAVMARGAAGLVRPEYSSGKFYYQEGEPADNLSVTLVDLDSPVRSDDRTTVLSGRKIENIPDSELGKSDLITDIHGPLAYSNRPDQVLAKYVAALKDEGKMFVSMGSNQDISGSLFGETNAIIGRDGVSRNFIEWLQAIPGLRVKVHQISGKTVTSPVRAKALEIEKVPGQAVQIPELEDVPVFLEPGGPPRLVLKEKSSNPFGVEARGIQDAREATRIAIQQATSNDTTDGLLAKFKPAGLGAALKRVSDGQWAHLSKVSPEVERAISSPEPDDRIKLRGNLSSKSPVGSVVESPSGLKPDKSLKLISDDGPLSWGYRPDLTLKSYLDALADDGEILINLGSRARGQGLRTSVYSQAGEEFKLDRWLRRANGLDVKIHVNWEQLPEDDKRVARIRIKDRAQIEIPELQVLGAQAPIDDGTQSVLLQEKHDFEPKISTLRRVGKSLAIFWQKYLA